MYQNIPTKVLTGEVRLSYVNLIQPKAHKQGGDPKYSVTLLIPKTDAATLNDISQSMNAAYEDGVQKKWGGARPTGRQLIYDGDGLTANGLPFGEECKGHYVITASSTSKPQVVGMDNIACELAPQDIYSGMYARVTINFFAYDTQGSKGVGCGLGNVMKTRDGEALAGGASAASDFEGVGSVAAPAYQQPGIGVPMAAPQTAPAYQQPAYTGINPITGQPM